MRIKHRGRRKKPGWGRILALAAMIGAVIAVDAGIRPMVREAAAGQTQIAVNRIIQQAVLTVLEEDGLRYQSFVTLRQNQNGEDHRHEQQVSAFLRQAVFPTHAC